MRGRIVYRKVNDFTNKRIDAVRLITRFPLLRNLKDSTKDFEPTLSSAHGAYLSEVSIPEMVVSLECARVLHAMCLDIQPRGILDLGSGFSSFVFRNFAKQSPDAVVVSVDDDPKWLEITREFLAARGLNTDNLVCWHDLDEDKFKNLDIIFHDLGQMDVRSQTLKQVLRIASKNQSVLILDDMNKKPYRQYVLSLLRHVSCHYYDGQSFTKDEIGRYSYIVCKIGDTKHLDNLRIDELPYHA